MAKKLLEIAADIVQAQASSGYMSSNDIEQTLIRTFATLQKMQTAEEKGLTLEQVSTADEASLEERAPERGNPQDSIREDRVICLECGAEMRQLTAKHLGTHELSPREYKKKYGLPLKTPLAAKSLTKARSKAAKKRGLPENLVKFQEQRRQKKSEEGTPGAAPEDYHQEEATAGSAAAGGRRRKAQE